MSDFAQDLESIAGKASEILDALPAEESITAWDLKLKLKSALSPLYMALGMLEERGRIRIVPDGLTYRIHSTAASKAAQPVGIPIQISVPSSEKEPLKSS